MVRGSDRKIGVSVHRVREKCSVVMKHGNGTKTVHGKKFLNRKYILTDYLGGVSERQKPVKVRILGQGEGGVIRGRYYQCCCYYYTAATAVCS